MSDFDMKSGTQIGASILSTGQNIQSGIARSRMFDFQAKIADQNARMISQQTGLQEEQQRRETKAAIGSQYAAIAENGIAFTGGAADWLRQSAINGETDALNIRYKGETERISEIMNGSALRAAAKQARTNAVLSTIGTTGTLAEKLYELKNPQAVRTGGFSSGTL